MSVLVYVGRMLQREDGHRYPGELQNCPDLLAIAKDLTDRAIEALARLLHRLTVACGQNVHLFDDESARLGQFVDSIKPHIAAPAIRIHISSMTADASR